MATQMYGLSKGEITITEGTGSATSADHVELTVDLAVSLTKQDVIRILEQFKQYILKGKWTPA